MIANKAQPQGSDFNPTAAPAQPLHPAAGPVSTALLLGRLLISFSWQELRHHPWRNLAAVLAVTLGVALAFAVQLINASALQAFGQAWRSISAQADLRLRASSGYLDEALLARLARQPLVAQASPLLDLNSHAIGAQGQRVPLRLLGIDALSVAAVAPALLPLPAAAASRLELFAPDAVFLNAAAQRLLPAAQIQVQAGLRLQSLRVAGSLPYDSSNLALAVLDVAAAQTLFGLEGRLSGIDLRLRDGADASAVLAALALPASVYAAAPQDDARRQDSLSRAYRVNLSALALVALFTGAFLVFSVQSVSLSRRAPQLALLGVLGLTGRQRLHLVLAESLLLGGLGSAAGLALGAALAALALQQLGGDLGGGYFTGVAPALQWDGWVALLYGALGITAALVGGWWPAQLAQRLPPAQTLKGLGLGQTPQRHAGLSLALLLASAALAGLPPLFGLPLAAYLAVALLLLGGIIGLPTPVRWLLDRLAPRLGRWPLPLLAVERARRLHGSAAVAVSAVVASLSLAVALTVMVASFRDSMTQWLDVLLPADLYLRSAGSNTDTAYLERDWLRQVAAIDGVTRWQTQRSLRLQLAPDRAPVALLARAIEVPARALPLVGLPLPVPPGRIGIYVSEPLVDLYAARPGTAFPEFYKAFSALALVQTAQSATDSVAKKALPELFVAGVWRDYARQTGAVVMAAADFERFSGDRRVNDLALWLRAGADVAQVQQALVASAAQHACGNSQAARSSPDHGVAQDPERCLQAAEGLLEFASARQLRTRSMQMFERSFAVTYWLQAVAIAIGLAGVGASFSAQVLARRSEFGMLTHLGLTRRQILGVVALEGCAWTVLGALAGLLLGLGVSVLLVHVVNPQSFHWSMDLRLPWLHLLALCAAVVATGTLTAWLAGRAAVAPEAVLAVRQDW